MRQRGQGADEDIMNKLRAADYDWGRWWFPPLGTPAHEPRLFPALSGKSRLVTAAVTVEFPDSIWSLRPPLRNEPPNVECRL